MDRDIIVVWSDFDIAYVTLNGIEINHGIEHRYEVGSVLIDLFDNLQYSYNKPLVVEIYDEDYDFSDKEKDVFWDRIWDRIDEDSKKTIFFTEDELQVLYNTEDVKQFVNKIKENLQLRIKKEE